MKHLKHIFLLITAMIFTMSCSDDGGTSDIDLIVGAIPDLVKSSETAAYFDYNLIQNNQDVKVAFNVKVAQGNPTNTDIIAVYKAASGAVYNTTLFTNVTLPQEFSITMSFIIESFPELSSFSDIQLGDTLLLSTKFTLNNGTTVNIIDANGSSNVSSSIQTTSLFTTQISYPVSCPSSIGGTYTVISNGVSTEPGIPPAVNLPYEVTLTDNGGGSYSISDFSSGVYIYWYSIYGLTFEQEADIVDVCGTISGDFTDAWGDPVTLTGTVNEDGTISIYWENAYADYANSVLTLKQ